MKALITGGVGFVGQYVAQLLVKQGWETEALDSLSPQVHDNPQAAVERFPGPVHVGDVCDPRAWKALEPADVVIHLAAETGTAQSMYEVDRYRSVNVDGTRQAADAALTWQSPFVFTSSRAVYGEGMYHCPLHAEQVGRCCPRATPQDSRESDPLSPVSVYGETKAESEQLLTTIMTGRLPLTVIRPQNVIGPGQALHNPYTGVLAAFLARLREGRSLTVYGDGSATRDFVHVSDLARLIAWATQNPSDPEQPRLLNCGTGVRTTLTQLAQAAAAGSPQGVAPLEYVQVHRAGDIDHACADTTLLRQSGGPTPQWSSREAIIDFIRASWDQPGASSDAWDKALHELTAHGMTS
ncbi:NAD-dependent epimerase/dehydratase family protein [Actinomyces urogenitalis]|uniref:NAD-dependent epimerase/dehydratase family protein n=1 Tax=Actinomyces urogenitalis TaxID=103621 RepID=UPI00242BAB45|nr:NAD(P)-dependent oxidoreductase [Actinomyces urogenitalis]MCI7455839.1 NAD(P)-dependent oxidoreductase [Actinomyces urogenitalis]